MNDNKKLPIGVFDSGLGGLTVAREINRQLPREHIIYVGDTARVPYGTKSPLTIQRYALQIAFFLMQRQVKMIVVACNTASAVALGALKKLPVAVIGVIEPGARAAILASQSMKIGVIGTQATVFSHAYRKAIRRYSRTALIYEVPCPLFVPLVEEGRLEGPVTALAIREYISPILKKKIDTLVLGCTHYPLLKPALKKVVGQRIQLIDSAERTAERVKEALERDKLLNPSPKRGNTSCFVTDHPADFNSLSQRFLGYRLGRAKRFEIESPVG